MNGSPTPRTEREVILEAMKKPPVGGYFVWDGVDEDDRPATHEEMQAGIQADLQRRTRPKTIRRPTLSLRVDPDVLERLRESGKGWQTRVHALLRKAVEQGLV